MWVKKKKEFEESQNVDTEIKFDVPNEALSNIYFILFDFCFYLLSAHDKCSIIGSTGIF